MNFKEEYIKYKNLYKKLINDQKKKFIKKNKINGGNIKMEEDYIFHQSNKNIDMKDKNNLTLNEAILKFQKFDI